jgi:hypothetical protein
VADSVSDTGAGPERGIGVQLPQTISGRHRSIAFIAAGVLMLILALVHAGVAMLFAFLASSPRRTTVRIGDDMAVLYSDFAYNGTATFLVLCLISGYAGLAAIRGWHTARLAAGAAGGATIVLCLYWLWGYANMLMPGLPWVPFSIGIRTTPMVFGVLSIIGIIILLAACRPTKTPMARM